MSFSLLLPRIQTGKLSEFVTTSCLAHLSFLDGKGSGGGGGGGSRRDEEYDDDDDAGDDDERGADGYVHELRCDDGKENEHRGMDGWGSGGETRMSGSG